MGAINLIMEKIAVIGAGTMGNGIAHVFAMHGFKVSLVDVSDERLEKALETIGKNLWRMVAKEKIKESTKQETIAGHNCRLAPSQTVAKVLSNHARVHHTIS